MLGAKNLPGEGKKHGNRYYDGFYIMTDIDRRWYEKTKNDKTIDHYTVVVRSSTELLFKMPAWDYDVLHERDKLARLATNGYIDEELLVSVDTALNLLLEKQSKADRKKREYTYMLIKFKGGVQLDGTVLDESFSEENPRLLASKMVVDGKGKMYWKIARVDTESYKKGKTETDVAESRGASLWDSPDKAESGGMDDF